MIFVNVQDTTISVTGNTFDIRSKLGTAGLGFKFNKDKKQWTGRLSLKALEVLQEQSGASLGPEAMDAITDFRLAAQKRAAYMASRRAN
jgi:hypothetical protein